jgi:hypothetical protein
MPADLVPHAQIPELAGHVTPDMLDLLLVLQKTDFILNGPSLPPSVIELLDELTRMGLVDAGYEGDVAQGRPYLWSRNGNGSRVIGYRTGIRFGPHYQIASAALAEWLEEQGEDSWWNVGGDPLLTGRMTFPSPAGPLANELRKINRPLIVQAAKSDAEARGQEVGKDKLDQLASRLPERLHRIGSISFGRREMPDRAFYLCWPDSLFEWTLSEDGRMAQQMRAREKAWAKKE